VTFTILLHPKASQELKKISEPMRSRIRGKLKELRYKPERLGKKLRYTDFWSLRIGDHRAIYEIKRESKRVIILFVGHRRNVYDNFSKLV